MSHAAPDAATAHAIAIEAYTYLYPLITMDVTRRQMTNVPAGTRPGFGPMGTLSHMRAFPPADLKVVVRPNFDTLYSSAWLDIRHEPVILSVPASGDRYYLLPLYDMWTDAFAVPGTRTSGNGEGHFAITLADWHGELPPGVERIVAPTPTVWLIGRTQTNGVADYAAVNAFQDGMSVVPLSQWGREPAAVPAFSPDPTVDMHTPPLELVNGLSGAAYLAYGAELLQLHPAHLTDWSILARMARIGIVPGKAFDATALPRVIQDAVAAAPQAALAILHERLPTMAKVVNGWSMNTDTMGVYGDAYTKRAIVTMVGLGANQARDAVYPLLVADSEGRPLDGGSDYQVHFPAGELPPVDAFWSITMYDADGFQAPNELDRFAIGDRDALVPNADGSLDIWISHTNPGPERVANWLPAPLGPLGITMRLYAPAASVLGGQWVPPVVVRTA
ncbi:MAG: DUF1254 domain-containing protein [Chloroflexota bacterium]